jgi:hypothetical protein
MHDALRRVLAAIFALLVSGCFPAAAAESQPATAGPPGLVEPTLEPPPATGAPAFDRPVTSADPRTYSTDKIVAMVTDHLATNGNFRMSVVPMTRELAIAAEYPKWAEKRYGEAEMVELARAGEGLYADSMYAVLTIVFVGDVFSTGRTQFEVPEDLAEYIFLENDRGQAIRCSRTTLPLMRMVGPFTKQVNVELQFDGLKRDPDFLRTKSLKFVVGGMELESNEVVYRYPLTELFADAPAELQRLYRAAGVWK